MAPRAELHGATFDRDGDTIGQLFQMLGGPPFRGRFELPSARIDALREVAFAMQQRHRHERQTHVGGSANGIAREHAQAAAVGRQLGVESDLHREVCDGLWRSDFLHGEGVAAGWEEPRHVCIAGSASDPAAGSGAAERESRRPRQMKKMAG